MPDFMLQPMRSFFETGITCSYGFRKAKLQLLKDALLKYEAEIYSALYSDLKKNREETYATELGLVISEINVALKNLKQWMRPASAHTDLANLPSASKIYYDPLGIVLIIAPWNYPFQLLLIPLVGAIAGGNCAVLKPSEFAPATANIIEKIIKEIFQPEYINIIQGEGGTVIPEMMNSFRFDHIFYTGSIPVGKAIYQLAATNLVPVTLELGGKSPAIIENDANIAVAAKRIALGKFSNAGQTCIAPDYVLVHESVKEEFVAQLRKVIRSFFGENANQSDSYGKIINEKRFDRLLSYLPDGRIIIGGENDREKLFIAPTVLDHICQGSAIMKEEIFGPILPLLSFGTFEEAKGIISCNSKPLAFYVFTSSTEKEKKWINAVSFGGGCINNANWHFTNHHIPFGGIGNSGIGAYHGKSSFNTFTHAKPVMKTPTWFDPKIKYPPFKGRLKIFKWIIR
ncbi:MAG: aldehyde dehydrogenase [Bacteroidetes bacterium]|nr:aldehyde dehydrogenase [Bacteroidota bacterium]MBS1974787.1 aldehyde dehydrogenase [Bacteroidota bacterium]